MFAKLRLFLELIANHIQFLAKYLTIGISCSAISSYLCSRKLHNKNEVTSLGDSESFIPNFSSATMSYLNPLIVKVGEPLGSFFGYKFKGIIQADEDISSLPVRFTRNVPPETCTQGRSFSKSLGVIEPI